MVESLNSSTNPLMIKTPEERPYTFLSNDKLLSNKTSPFLTDDKLSGDRPSASLSEERTVNNEQSPLTVNQEDKDENSNAVKQFELPKNSETIIAELRRNAMHSTMTARDIAKEYNIPYSQAQEIFIAVNEDKNGFVQEFNLSNNSTVSFLV